MMPRKTLRWVLVALGTSLLAAGVAWADETDEAPECSECNVCGTGSDGSPIYCCTTTSC